MNIVAALLRKIKGIKKDGLDFDGISTMTYWLNKMGDMRASDELSEEDARQLIFDLEKSYGGFHSFLSH